MRRRPLTATLLLVLLFVAVWLPTGSIFALNVKTIFFALYSLAFVFFLATNSSDWPTPPEQIFLGLFAAALCFWSLIGILHGIPDVRQVFLQLKDIASTVLIAWFCIFFVRRRLLEPENITLAVVCAGAAVGLVKIGLVVATFVLHINPVLLIESVFGQAALVSGDIGLGLTRLGFPSDVVGGFSMFAVLCPTVSGIRLRRRHAALLIAPLLVSGLLSYSRYLWFVYFFAIVAASAIERRFKFLLFLVISVCAIGGVFYEALSPVLVARFSSEQTSDSDLVRIEQSQSLLQEIRDRPILGKGLGQYAPQTIRNQENRYSYELQWLSLLMQTGAIGIAAILVLLFVAARDLFLVQGRAKFWVAALFVLWLLGSWTNPYLLSSFAGATFGMFMAMFHRMRVLAESARSTPPLAHPAPLT